MTHHHVSKVMKNKWNKNVKSVSENRILFVKSNYIFLAPVTCERLSLKNGQVNYNTSSTNGKYLIDAKASFTCFTGYFLSGSNSAICKMPGAWNQETSQCLEGKRKAYYFH